VSASIVTQIRTFAANAPIERVLGVDAYEVASSVASGFRPGSTVYVATGAVFADGLAGGAVASSAGVPVIVVPPTGMLPGSVTRTLEALRPSRIVVLGGPAAVSNNIENQLANYLPI
jgi:putative cell wall-binding protein